MAPNEGAPGDRRHRAGRRRAGGTPAHPESAPRPSRRRRGGGKRAGETPAHPGPAFGGVAPLPAGAARVADVRAGTPAHPGSAPLPGIAGIRGTLRGSRGCGAALPGARAFPPTPRRAGTCGLEARGPGPRLRRGCASPGGRRAGRQRAGGDARAPRKLARAPLRGIAGIRRARGLALAPSRQCRGGRERAGRMPAVPGPAFGGVAPFPAGAARVGNVRAGTPAHPGSSRGRRCGALRGSAGLGAWRPRLPGNAAAGGNVRAGCPRSRAPPSAGLRLPRRAPRGAGSPRLRRGGARSRQAKNAAHVHTIFPIEPLKSAQPR